MLSRRDKLLLQPWEERRFKDHRSKVKQRTYMYLLLGLVSSKELRKIQCRFVLQYIINPRILCYLCRNLRRALASCVGVFGRR